MKSTNRSQRVTMAFRDFRRISKCEHNFHCYPLSQIARERLLQSFVPRNLHILEERNPCDNSYNDTISGKHSVVDVTL